MQKSEKKIDVPECLFQSFQTDRKLLRSPSLSAFHTRSHVGCTEKSSTTTMMASAGLSLSLFYKKKIDKLFTESRNEKRSGGGVHVMTVFHNQREREFRGAGHMPLFSLRPHVFDEIILSTSLYIYSPFLCCVFVCYLINTLFSLVCVIL